MNLPVLTHKRKACIRVMVIDDYRLRRIDDRYRDNHYYFYKYIYLASPNLTLDIPYTSIRLKSTNLFMLQLYLCLFRKF